MDIVKTLFKVLVILAVYAGGAPAIARWTRGQDGRRRFMLGFLAWWLVRPRSDFTLTLYSIEEYRGHTKGFEFNFLEAIALGLSLAAMMEKRKDFRWRVPALGLWVLWVAASCLSVTGAIEPLYVWMPAWKFLKIAIVTAGVFHAVHGVEDIRALMRGFSWALVLQLFVCLYFRYVKGAFRVIGWFEHQNPMAMWSYMLAFPLLGLAMAKETSRRDFILHLAGFGAAGLVVILTVSRAALAAYIVGTALVMVASFLQGITLRRVLLTSIITVGGVAALAMAMNTLVARMKGAGDDSAENDLRFVLNRQSAAMLSDHPVAGIGWNNFGLANSRPLGTQYSEILEAWEANRGHSIYPEQFQANPLTESLYWLVLAETGWAGFTTFMLFEVVTLWFLLRGLFRHWKSPLGLFLAGLLVSFTISYLHGRVERVLTQTKNLTTLMIFVGVAARVHTWRKRLPPGAADATL
ncbi:O-antigen ligase family protein [Luteolibacter sp. LG18]|uniref:O-antigen ligase family protein n=1 Tax=Luteolibacter sp. LG18 TaxID=2819286 RepID=UPI002B29CEFC|nr:hypothetical protein llg_42790 [Luteolibacter sp. LG18]